MEIVKAEILWTRHCPNKCSYCSMATGKSNTLSVDEWKKGIDNLKALGCGFIAFYGAEPLHDTDFYKLPHVVKYAEDQGIHTTVITSGVATDLAEKIVKLINYGLRSLSMSYDIVAPDAQTQAKSNKAMQTLSFFQKMCPDYRDVAAITTLTSKNVAHLPSVIMENTRKNIWTFFDIIHPDRGQEGSKCKNFPGIEKLLFRTKEDLLELDASLSCAMLMKRKKFLVHASSIFAEYCFNGAAKKYDWNCAEHSCFPSWVTIDCDGTVQACDDFSFNSVFKVWNIARDFETFSKIAKDAVLERCPGCCWNTHIDAHAIKLGVLPFSNYVHTKE